MNLAQTTLPTAALLFLASFLQSVSSTMNEIVVQQEAGLLGQQDPEDDFPLRAEKAQFEPFRGLMPAVPHFTTVVTSVSGNLDEQFGEDLRKAMRVAAADLGWIEGPGGLFASLVLRAQVSRLDPIDQRGAPVGSSAAYIAFDIYETGGFIRESFSGKETGYSPAFEWEHRIKASIYSKGQLVMGGPSGINQTLLSRLRVFLDTMKLDVRKQREKPIGGAILVDGFRQIYESALSED